jgi:hypothetical protein
MFVDNFIPVQGDGYAGGIENYFQGRHFDPGLRRPYLDSHDRPCVTINTGRWTIEKGQRVPLRERRLLRDLILNGTVPPVFNATALRKEEWIQLDTKILLASRYRLRAYADLAAANSFGGFNGMSKMILEHETMSDPGEAIVDMDGLTDGRADSPKFQLQGLPLPITHSDFWYSSRVLAISRNTSTPLDTTMGEAAGRRVAETIEKTTIGNQTGVTYGGSSTQTGGYGRTSQVYGYLNFPDRLTKNNLTVPNGTNPSNTISDVLAMRDSLYLNKFTGPFMLYHSNDWDKYMDNDYILTGGNVATQTLRERLKSIEGIQDVRRLDFLFGTVPATSHGPGTENLVGGGGGTGGAWPFTLIMVQMTPDVARAVNAMDITTVQWESVGGMRLNFKVMCIQVPQLRSDNYGNCGILQATTA